MIAPTLARPTGQALADELERLGHLFNAGWTPDEEIWAQVDALAPGLSEAERSDWFEQLYTALAVREGDYEISDYAADERDPDRIERSAREAVDEAIAHLARWA